MELVGTAQCQEISHLLPEPFYQVMQAQVGEPTTQLPTSPSVSTSNLS